MFRVYATEEYSEINEQFLNRFSFMIFITSGDLKLYRSFRAGGLDLGFMLTDKYEILLANDVKDYIKNL